jgi:hypothetical protein
VGGAEESTDQEALSQTQADRAGPRREAARAVDTWLMGYSNLEAKDESFVNVAETA